MRHVFMILFCAVFPTGGNKAAATEWTEYLSDRQDLIVQERQGWGRLGFDVAAHAGDQHPRPIKIKDKAYAKGLGHHASGEILIDLGGQYSLFEAEVGLQALPESPGSVVFQVLVDDRKVFDSGVMRATDAARPVSVSLTGALELRLVVTDAGDGINSDCANWADARLTRDLAAGPGPASEFDVARFARVVTSDPARMDGARRSRIQEFLAEDLSLDKDVLPDEQARYIVPTGTDGRCAIGLRWIERRHVRSLAIEFAGDIDPARAENAEVQFWVGQSPYQGQWRMLNGCVIARSDHWRFRVDGKQNPDLRAGTWKIRWVIPAGEPVRVRRLQAFTASIVRSVDLSLQLESVKPGEQIELELYNGEFVEPAALAGRTLGCLDGAASIPLTIRFLAHRSWQADRAVVRIRRPERSFAVALDDVLSNRAVYVPAGQALCCLADEAVTPADYRVRIADRQTILQQVRARPDQSFDEAIAKVHRAQQDVQFTMLSLACDNNKFIVHRDGAVSFAMLDNPDEPIPPDNHNWPCLFKPICGSGKNEKLDRHLDGGWYPIPVVTIQDNGVTYRQRAFVVPYDRQSAGDSPWLNPKPLLAACYLIENTGSQPADASVQLQFVSDTAKNQPAEVGMDTGRAIARSGSRLLAAVDAAEANSLHVEVNGGTVTLKGRLPAGGKAEFVVYLPGWKLAPDDHVTLTGGDALVTECKAYWDRLLAPAMTVDVPDPLLVNVIKASQVHCLLAARNEAGGQRIAPWIASVSYGPLESESNSIIRGMSFFGHDEFARRSFDFFIHRYDPAGFLTTGYTLMGTGWHLWMLGEHYQLARDAAWLRRVAPKVTKVCEWVIKQREKTRQPDAGARSRLPLEAGLMPPGVMADWNVFAFYFCLNGYFCAGLDATGKALTDIQEPQADAFVKDAESFRKDILHAYRTMQAISPVLGLRNGTFVPPYPTQLLPGPTGLFFPGEDGNRSWCYDVEIGVHHLVPFGILPADGEDVGWMLDHMEDVHFLSDGWFDYPAVENEKDPFNFGGFAKVQPYYARNAEVYALRDDVKPFIRSYFNTIPSLLSIENLCFQEHFHGVGAQNKTHETGYFLHQTRIMLVMERDDELWLAPLITDRWLEDGRTVSVKNAPTFFGPVSYTITSHISDGSIEAMIDPPTRSAPRQIVLRLRHPQGKPFRKIEVDGKDHDAFEPDRQIVRLEPTSKTMHVQARF